MMLQPTEEALELQKKWMKRRQKKKEKSRRETESILDQFL